MALDEGGGLTPSSNEAFRRYLLELRQRFISRGKVPPGLSALLDYGVLDLAYLLSGPLLRTPGLFRSGAHKWPLIGGMVGLRTPNPPCSPLVVGARRYLFQWATKTVGAGYAERSAD